MAAVPGTWTVKDVLSVVREMTKTVEQRKVLSEQGKYFYNLAISEVVSLLNSALDPAYFYSEVITLGTDIVLEKGANMGGKIKNINSVPDTIVSNANVLPIGCIISVSTWSSTGTPLSQWVGKVISKSADGLTATYEILYGLDVDFSDTSGDYANVNIIKTLSTLTYDLTSLSKEVDRIVVILDSVYGEVVEVKPNEFYSISRSDFSHKSYDDDIIYTRIGNKLYFRNGANIVNPGVKTVVYQRQPDYPVSYDDNQYADIANKFVPLLAKRIYTYILLQLENDIPKNLHEEMVLDYQSIANYASREIENKNVREKKG